MVTFAVDGVEAVTDRLPTVPLSSLAGDALAVGGDPGAAVLVPDGVHPLLSAVGRAFAEHRPLVLTPDAVWLTIAQGIAQHVRLNAEQVRPLLVHHEGRRRLTVTLEGPMPADAPAWATLVEGFTEQLAAQVEDAALFECDFSTSTAVERTAGRVVLLDAYAPYFSLLAVFVCGIPSITLAGTGQDWRTIRDRVARLPGFGLDTWCRSLLPIADQFVRAASGDVDVRFWRRIYSPADAYGGDVITGWAARFYPYLRSAEGRLDGPNPLLELSIGRPRRLTDPSTRGTGYRGPGVRSDDVPATLSRAVVDVNDRATGDNRAVVLSAGLVGVAQNPDGALVPVAGWHLAPATPRIEDVVDRLVREQVTVPPVPTPVWELPAEAVALYDRIGAATLFGGAWQVLPVADHRHASLGDRAVGVCGIARLPGDRMLAAVSTGTQAPPVWAVCRIRPGGHPGGAGPRWRVDEDPAGIPGYGTSLAMILEAALDSGGDIEHLRTGRLTSS